MDLQQLSASYAVRRLTEADIPAAQVWASIGEKPLFGHHSGRKMNTFWGCFMKLKEDTP